MSVNPIPDADAWGVFTQVGVVVIFLATLGGAVWKIVSVRRDKPRRGRPGPTAPDLEQRVADIERALAGDYISRADWIPIASRMMGLMERNTEMLARLDERTRK